MWGALSKQAVAVEFFRMWNSCSWMATSEHGPPALPILGSWGYLRIMELFIRTSTLSFRWVVVEDGTSVVPCYRRIPSTLSLIHVSNVLTDGNVTTVRYLSVTHLADSWPLELHVRGWCPPRQWKHLQGQGPDKCTCQYRWLRPSPGLTDRTVPSRKLSWSV